MDEKPLPQLQGAAEVLAGRKIERNLGLKVLLRKKSFKKVKSFDLKVVSGYNYDVN